MSYLLVEPRRHVSAAARTFVIYFTASVCDTVTAHSSTEAVQKMISSLRAWDPSYQMVFGSPTSWVVKEQKARTVTPAVRIAATYSYEHQRAQVQSTRRPLGQL